MSGHFWAMLHAPDDDGARAGYARTLLRQLGEQRLFALQSADAKVGTMCELQLFVDERRRGQAWNFLRALRAGLASGAERITLLEDDIEICRGFVQRVERQPIPDDCAFISWFDPFLGMPGRLGDYYAGDTAVREAVPDAPGFVRRLCSKFYCNQALTFRRATVEQLLTSPVALYWEAAHEGDMLIAQALQHTPYAVHAPSLVQHVGTVSLCNPGEPLKKNRISHHYPGRDFFAGALPVFT